MKFYTQIFLIKIDRATYGQDNIGIIIDTLTKSPNVTIIFFDTKLNPYIIKILYDNACDIKVIGEIIAYFKI